MTTNALNIFSNDVSNAWGPLSSELVVAVRGYMDRLLQTPSSEEWLDELHRTVPPTKELIRHAQHGFILQAHTEPAGLYRPPHDHGRSWVVYAVVHGESEMCTYGRVEDPDGSIRLVKRDSTRVRSGQIQVYLPGDIHDTRCIAGPALLYRFTERDLKKEDRDDHRITRYVERNGAWTAP